MSNYAIPTELSYDELSRMFPSRKLEYRRQPFNSSTFVPGSTIQIALNRSERSFFNGSTLSLIFKVECTLSNLTPNINALAQITDNDTAISLLGNAWSHFSAYSSQMQGSGFIDQIQNPGPLVNLIMNSTTSATEKYSMVSFGFNNINPYCNTGLEISEPFGLSIPKISSLNVVSSNTYVKTYAIPIIGALTSCDKMLPMMCGDIELNFTLANISSYIYRIFPATSQISVNMVMSDVEIVGEILELETEGYNTILQMYPGVFNIKSKSYSFGSGMIPGSYNGSIDQIVPFSVNSMTQFYWACSPSDAVDLGYSGVNPNVNSYQLMIGSTAYPQSAVKATSLAELYYQLVKSFGGWMSTSHSGSTSRVGFAKASTAGNEFVQYTSTMPSFANKDSEYEFNKCYFALDLETINQLKTSLYSGISTRSGVNILRINIIRPTKANIPIAISMYGVYDCIINFDYVNKRITCTNYLYIVIL